jgi:hypothetical protein
MSEEIQADAAPVDDVAVSEPATSEPEAKSDSFYKSFEAVHDKVRPARNESGQFSRRIPTEGELAGLQDLDVEETPPQDETETKAEQIAKPQAWGKKVAEHWDKLPLEIKQEIAKREQDIQRFISERGNASKSEVTQQLESIASRFADTLPRVNGQPMPTTQMMEHFLAANHALETNPREALQWLAKSYGVDLGGQPADVEQVRAQAYAEAQSQLQQHYQQQQQQQYEQQHRQTENYLLKFAADKPYFSQIENQVLYHIMALKSVDPDLDYRELLQLAHDKALAERPELDVEKTAKAKAEARRRADEAKRLASLNVKSTTGKSPRSSKDIWGDMAATYDRLNPGR